MEVAVAHVHMLEKESGTTDAANRKAAVWGMESVLQGPAVKL